MSSRRPVPAGARLPVPDGPTTWGVWMFCSAHYAGVYTLGLIFWVQAGLQLQELAAEGKGRGGCGHGNKGSDEMGRENRLCDLTKTRERDLTLPVPLCQYDPQLSICCRAPPPPRSWISMLEWETTFDGRRALRSSRTLLRRLKNTSIQPFHRSEFLAAFLILPALSKDLPRTSSSPSPQRRVCACICVCGCSPLGP